MPKMTSQNKAKQSELPDTLKRSSAKAQRTFAKAHDAAVEQYGEGDEQEAEEGERERQRPLVAAARSLVVVEASGEGKQEVERQVRKELDAPTGPFAAEVDRGEVEAVRAEDGVGGAPRRDCDDDVDERGDRDERPVRVALVPEEEQRPTDRDTGRDVQPEPVRPGRTSVDRQRCGVEGEAREERHDGRPVPAARDEVGGEVPGRDGNQHDDERKAEDA